MKTHARNYQTGFTLLEYIVVLVIAAIMAAIVYNFMGSALTQSSVPIERLKQSTNLNRVMENIVADYNRLNELNLRYVWKPSTVYNVGSVVVPKTRTSSNGHYYRATAITGTGTSGASEPTPWPTTGPVTDGGVTWTESGLVRNSNTAYTAGQIVVPYYNNGHYYTGTAGTTATGATEPTWPSTTGGTVIDGGVTWTEAGTILSRNTGTAANSFTSDNLYELLATSTRYGTGYTVTEKVFVKFDPSTQVESNISGTEEKNILKVTIKNNDSNETLRELFTIR